MKNKLIAGIAMSVMLLGTLAATPAQSQHRDDRWGVDSNRNSPYYGRQVGDNRHYYERHGKKKNNNDALIAGVAGLIIGGMIVGAAQSQPAQQPYQTYPDPQYPVYTPPPVYVPTTVCRYEWVKDYYGNYSLDVYGRPYQIKRCWQQ